MADETPQPAAEAAPQASGDTSGSALDKAKNFITMGGDKDKWTKAIIVSVLVVLFMGLGSTAVWGAALAFWVRSIAEPNGNSALACFDKTFTDNWVVSGPDVSKAVRSETRTFYVTSYCPPETGQHPIEGGQWTSSNVHVGLGAVAVPPFSMSNPDITSSTPDYPWGTTFDIPGYGRGVAVDHGCAIQKAGVDPSCKSGNWSKTPNDHLDIFVGNGSAACNKWPTKSALQVKVYWFDPKVYPPSHVKDFVKAVQTSSTYGGSQSCPASSSSGGNSSMDFRSVGPGLGEFDQVGIWKNIIDVQNAVGKPGQNNVPYTFMGHPITGNVNKAITPALDKVQADLKAAGVTYNFSDLQGAQVRENKNRAHTISPHGFGTAIDINPNVNTNNKRTDIKGSKPRDAASCPTNIPKIVSDIFQKNGFFWGAKFYCTCDSMHFMYGGNYDTSQIAWPSLKLLPADKKSSCPTLKP